MGEWQPIKSAPKDGTKVLLWWDGDFAPVAKWERGAWVYDMISARPSYVADGLAGLLIGYEPTHWMPLPSLSDGGR